MSFDLSRKGSYAVRAMVALAATRDGGLQKARRIAADTAIPAAYLPQILGALIRRGLVSSHAGPHGGYVLTREPDSISLLEIVEAVDGPLKSAECALRGGPCTPTDPCMLHHRWQGAQAALVGQLAACSLADLVEDDVSGESPAGTPQVRP